MTNKSQTTMQEATEQISNKNRIIVSVNLVHNNFFDRVDTEYECAIHIVDESALSNHSYKSCIHEFLASFCDTFADAVQSTDMNTFNALLNAATGIGFYVVYPEFVDKAMSMDAKIKTESGRRVSVDS